MVDVVVVGAGVNGLCVASELRQRGLDVEVWARDDSMATVSAVAGAIWFPFLAEPRERVLGWSAVTFQRLATLARRRDCGIAMAPVTATFAEAAPDLWWAPAAGPIERLPAAAVRAPCRSAIRTVVPIVDVPVHLAWLRAHVESQGVRFVPRVLASFAPAFAVARTVVNCAGLGAAALCADASLVPVRGQVVLVERSGDVPAWIDDSGLPPFYAIPRSTDVVLGGTAQRGDADLQPRIADTEAILAGIGERVPQLREVVVRGVKVGLRPYRPTVRVELEPRPEGRLVHDYGHGGSGWTLAWGCAAEVADFVVG
ncbi:MAG: FAD-binding oxidoreductase [Planctomycetes bacterium]|nr:FAD-binding oxidoreductase [Planctomycetota bacterium]